MPRPPQLPIDDVRRWATAHVARHPKDLTHALAEAFGVTRAAAAPVVRRLEAEGFVVRTGGSTRPVFSVGASRCIAGDFALAGLDESTLWERHFLPLLDLPPHVANLVHYGFTEIVNNAIDHSAGRALQARCAVAGAVLYLWIGDDGIGLFERMRKNLQLEDPRMAMLELSKGRVTTDPARHSGEGIFFTSRAFAVFKIEANDLVYERRNPEPAPQGTRPVTLPPWPGNGRADGTRVTMALRTDTRKELRDIFAEYTTCAPDDLSFDRTVIPVKLVRLGNENLLSRSQAKRLLGRVEQFKVVELDFEGVPEIGQAFADEIFRVFARANPTITLKASNAGTGVAPMIRRVRGA
jgi:STAS-like domain of unknown function (DUF4325)